MNLSATPVEWLEDGVWRCPLYDMDHLDRYDENHPGSGVVVDRFTGDDPARGLWAQVVWLPPMTCHRGHLHEPAYIAFGPDSGVSPLDQPTLTETYADAKSAFEDRVDLINCWLGRS
jgi:hypothetical protein